MAKPGRKPDHTDEALAEEALRLQNENPLMSEGAICSRLFGRNHGREHLADRAKKSEVIKQVRKQMSAIREWAWIERGMEGIENVTHYGENGKPIKGVTFNAVMFIWMTRNILGWRDDKSAMHKNAHKPKPPEGDEKLKELLTRIRAFVAEKGVGDV